MEGKKGALKRRPAGEGNEVAIELPTLLELCTAPPNPNPRQGDGEPAQNCLSETKAALFHQSKGKASLAACRV